MSIMPRALLSRGANTALPSERKPSEQRQQSACAEGRHNVSA